MKNLFRALLSLGVMAAYFHFEGKRPLRKETEPKLRRVARNLTMAGLSALTIQAVETPIVSPLARWVGRKRVGLLKLRELPRWLEVAYAVALMDYTLFLWHIFVHKNRLLWRFHAVHHADLDLDASTALRFHFGEIALSVPYRALQVLVLGIDEESFRVWQRFLSLSILFHHSNVRLPLELERFLSRLVATPRMHGIHHSQDFAEQWTNWSSGLALWDYLHGTYRFDVPQESIRIGLQGATEQDVTLPRIVEMPFLADSPPAPQASQSALPKTRIEEGHGHVTLGAPRVSLNVMQKFGLLLAAVIVTSGLAWAQSKPYPKPQIPSAEGKVAPDFSLKNQDGKDFRLSGQRGHWILLFFYRGYW